MKYNGIILKKIGTIQRELNLLRGLKDITPAAFEADPLLKHGVERALQICVEAMLDIVNRIIALAGKPPAATSAEAMETAQAMGILKDRSVYVKMIQFRNFIVHRYESIDNAILSDICTHRLDDFETFIREIDGA